MNPQLQEILKLSKSERILLVEYVWDSIANDAEPDDFELTDAQKKEIDRRSGRACSWKSKLCTWDEVEARIKAQR
ncbi:MAG: addiction module protein [Bacteroidota bacterium]